MARLASAGVRGFIIRGNHDALSPTTKNLALPDGFVQLSSRRAETHVLEDIGVAVHGQSYPRHDGCVRRSW